MSLALLMAGILAFSLAGCGGSSTSVHPSYPHRHCCQCKPSLRSPNPVFTASASGALSGDTFTLTASTIATPSSPAGTYSIVPAATGANLANYNVVYVNGTLTVGKATPHRHAQQPEHRLRIGAPHSLRHDHRLCQWRYASCRHRTPGSDNHRNLLLSGRLLPDCRHPWNSRLPPITALPSGPAPSPSLQRAIPVSASPAGQWPETTGRRSYRSALRRRNHRKWLRWNRSPGQHSNHRRRRSLHGSRWIRLSGGSLAALRHHPRRTSRNRRRQPSHHPGDARRRVQPARIGRAVRHQRSHYSRHGVGPQPSFSAPEATSEPPQPTLRVSATPSPP